jgi:hypothetical protein
MPLYTVMTLLSAEQRDFIAAELVGCASDASPYRLLPQAVVMPRNE